MSIRTELMQRANEFAIRHGLSLANELGAGVHGIVFLAKNQDGIARSAVKVHYREEAYQRERDIYIHLRDLGIWHVRGCAVPQLIRFDDAALAIEMTVVSRPFVLDFAGAYLHTPPTFSEEVMAEWRVEKQEQFGQRWSEVEAILRALEMHDIYMVDVSPGNVGLLD
jgi:hypothetical protein